jgi:hypothetical protein
VGRLVDRGTSSAGGNFSLFPALRTASGYRIDTLVELVDEFSRLCARA